MNRIAAIGLVAIAGVGIAASLSSPPHAAEIRVGSKAFTESVTLGEIFTGLLGDSGLKTEHRRELGGTRLLWDALLAGEIDMYPEYTGTITHEILAQAQSYSDDEIRKKLAQRGVGMSRSLGFNNTYAIGVSAELARRLGLEKISDLAAHPSLRLGFSNEFMDRADGWPSLCRVYHLPQTNVRGLDHDLAYRALASGGIDATDLYSTDAEIRYYHLKVLRDDLNHFPRYDAVMLYRLDLEPRFPRAIEVIRRLEGKISTPTMIDMNAAVKLNKQPESQVAARFLQESLGIHSDASNETAAKRVWRLTGEHLSLVGISMAAAIVLSVPLGILAARHAVAGQTILGITGIFQTIPSLALLVFMIPLLGIGTLPAIAALFLYSLLPIVRNTYTGLRDIAPSVRESAVAIGLPRGARLYLVELPIASRSILAGIKTSTVINVGTATLGALIGAGGYGQAILTGIRLDDMGLILQGAVPSALMALAAQGFFEIADRVLIPKGLRLKGEMP